MIKFIKEFSAKYPAVLSGYIIYSYLFITMMRFFLKAKSRELTVYEIYENFSALPFMWLISSALVKIIDMRTKLHDIEKERMLDLQDLKIKRIQLETMHEVAKGFQHRINNPLAIICLALSGMKRAILNSPAILERVILIEDETRRINQAVIDFSRAERYEVEHVGFVVGDMANPASTDMPANTETSPRSIDTGKPVSALSRPEMALAAA